MVRRSSRHLPRCNDVGNENLLEQRYRMKILTVEQQGDQADSETRFEKRYAEALGDSWREDVRRKTVALYEAHPYCGICKERIEDVSNAHLWEPAFGKPFILCNRAECDIKAIHASIDRYMGKPRPSTPALRLLELGAKSSEPKPPAA